MAQNYCIYVPRHGTTNSLISFILVLFSLYLIDADAKQPGFSVDPYYNLYFSRTE